MNLYRCLLVIRSLAGGNFYFLKVVVSSGDDLQGGQSVDRNVVDASFNNNDLQLNNKKGNTHVVDCNMVVC